MDKTFSILKAEQSDAPEIHQLIADVLGSYRLYHLRPDHVDDDIDTLYESYFNNNGYFWVGFKGAGKIIACVGIYNTDAKTCELRKMYLLPKEHGKGMGKMLLKTAIDKAKQLGYQKMILKTNAQLQTAIELYKKNGFEFYTISAEDKKEDCDIAMILTIRSE